MYFLRKAKKAMSFLRKAKNLSLHIKFVAFKFGTIAKTGKIGKIGKIN